VGGVVTRPTSEGHEGKRERIAGVFGRAASTYDQIGPRFFSLLGERLAALADIHRGQTVLDVACGRGASALPAAERVGSDGRVVGVDIAERMVDELTRDAARLGARNLEVAVMDAEDLKFPDGTFDRLLGGFCLFFFPRPERALAEMRRVLRPGGRLALSTWSKTDTGWRWLDDLVDSYLPGSASERHEEHAFTESPSGMREVLSRAGFEPVEVLAEAEELTYATEDEWWASLWTRGRRGALERIEAELGADGLARFEAEAREHLRAASGPVGQDVIRQVLPVLYSLAGKPGRELTGDPT
jgi:ubiquinone/menaquinone biosynthesis C-methylase UbiE